MPRLLSLSLLVTLLGSHVRSNPIIGKRLEPQYSKPLGHDTAIIEAPSSNDSIIPESFTWSQDELSKCLEPNDTSIEPFNNFTRSRPQYRPGGSRHPFKRFIDGTDDRYEFDSKDYPYRSIGKLAWSNGVYCSGALIGPRHVLTAKHCYVNNTSGTFSPGFDNGEPYGHAAVKVAIMSSHEWGTPCGWKNDWMVLILNKRLGDKLGYFGAKLPDHRLEDKAIFEHVGYPDDKDGNAPYRVDGNTVESSRPWDCDVTGPFYTDTDCAGGQSGGPHWQPKGVAGADGHYIWGTLSVTVNYGGGVAASGWGSGDLMLGAIREARRKYP